MYQLPPGGPARAPGCSIRGEIKLLVISSGLRPSGSGQSLRAQCQLLIRLFWFLPQCFLSVGSGDRWHQTAPGAALRVPCHDANPSHYKLRLILDLAMSLGDFPVLTHSTIARASELQHRSFLCINTASVPAAEGGGLLPRCYVTGLP